MKKRDRLLQKAWQQHQNGTLSLAKKLYLELLEHAQDDFEAQHRFGVLLTTLGEYDKAKDALQKALCMEPNNAQALYNLGVLYEKRAQKEEAVPLFEKAAYLHPTFLEPRFKLAMGYMASKNQEKELAQYEEILLIDPFHKIALLNAGNIYNSQKNFSKAQEYFLKIIQIDSDYFEAYYNLGNSFFAQKRYKDAIKNYAYVLRLNSKHLKALNNMASAYYLLKEYEEASKLYAELIVQEEGKVAETFSNLGAVFFEQGLFEASVECYQHAIKLDSSDASFYFNLGNSLYFFGLKEQAMAFFERALVVDDGYLQARIHLAVEAYLLGDFERCVQLLIKVAQECKSIEDEPILIGFSNFLPVLCREKSKEDSIATDSGVKELFVLGESHSLAFHNLFINYRGTKFHTRSHMVYGCKAWHLAQDINNRYKAAIKNYLDVCKEGVTVMFCIGEIDCRVNEGILRYHEKSAKPISEIVADTVHGYISFLAKSVASKHIRPIIYGVPAPFYKPHRFSDTEHVLLVQIIREFNDTLDKVCDNYRWDFLNPFPITADERGYSNLKYHLDGTHLKPKVLEILLEHTSLL